MTLLRRLLSSRLARVLISLFPACAAHAAAPAFHAWAERPVMGWNSWDYYGTAVNEERTKAQADYMAAQLLSYGWNLITVDIQWYEPNATGFNYNPAATHVMDEWGRLLPATNRFPSAAGGAGFKPLADYVHAKGLKFGIHMMRGIPRQAWQLDLPVKGTTYTARDIADTNSTCSWNPDMYGVDLDKPGAQAYYDSIFELVASWEVDFVKIDDLSRPYHRKEIEAIRRAIDKTGRPIVFSTSPGETPLGAGGHVELHANQWRISDDFWDTWGALYDQFKRLHDWTPYRGPGHFPDADMLPIGKVEAGTVTGAGRAGRFTTAEHYTLMSLWSIARSPLIHGGDMTQMDSFTLSLLTNPEVIAVNQRSTRNRQLFRTGDLIAWVADDEDTTDKYLAVFNTGSGAAVVPVALSALGYAGPVQIRSLWERAELGSFTGAFSPSVAAHGGALYRLRGDAAPTPWITRTTVADQQVSLTWEAVPGASAYRVKRAAAESGPYVVVADNLADTTHLDTALTNGTVYYYVVSAMVGGQETPDSGARSARPAGAPGIVSWNLDRYGTVGGAIVAGVAPAANWNNSWPSDPRTDLVDHLGAPTTLDISYASFGTWSIQSSGMALDADGTGNKRILNGYLNSGPAAWGPPTTLSSVTLTEIPHGYYDLVVYFSSDGANREGAVDDGRTTFYFKTPGAASVSGANAIFTPTTEMTDGQYPVANYAVFPGLTGDTRTVRVRMRDNDEWGGIAAVQVVPRNDPLPATHVQISVESAGGEILLTWPETVGDIVLETSTDLVNWIPADPQPSANSSRASLDGPRRFFRLRRP